MRLNKKIYVGVTSLVLIAGSAVALNVLPEPEPKAIEVRQTSATPVAEQETVPVESSPAAVEQTVTNEPTPAPKTTDDIKATARQAVLDDGQNTTQADCFEKAIQELYGWTNMTEESALAKFRELDSIYVAMCPAYGNYQSRGNDAPGFRD